ncbi:MAG: putative quinol monooxygenase [Promethearchaeota archaeon]
METQIAFIKIKEGKMDEAIDILKEIVPNVRNSEPDTKIYIAYTLKGDKNTIFFYEVYENKKAMDEHMSKLPQIMGKIFPLIEGAPDIKPCKEII